MAFRDLTPIEVVQKLNRRVGFSYIDTTTALVQHLPWPLLPGGARVSSDSQAIENMLTDPFRLYYKDHANCRWARHLVLIRGEDSCYVVWRMERHKNLPVFASFRYASNPELLRQNFGRVGAPPADPPWRVAVFGRNQNLRRPHSTVKALAERQATNV